MTLLSSMTKPTNCVMAVLLVTLPREAKQRSGGGVADYGNGWM